MGAATYTTKKLGLGQTVVDLKKYYLFEATVSKTNTITIAELTTITAVMLYNLTSGADIDCTILTNVITITEDPCSSVKIVGLVVGD